MKRFILAFITVIAGISIVSMTGCAAIYDRIANEAAVEKIAGYLEDAIDNSDDLSDQGKTKLKAEVAKLKDKISAKLEATEAEKSTPAAEPAK